MRLVPQGRDRATCVSVMISSRLVRVNSVSEQTNVHNLDEGRRVNITKRSSIVLLLSSIDKTIKKSSVRCRMRDECRTHVKLLRVALGLEVRRANYFISSFWCIELTE